MILNNSFNLCLPDRKGQKGVGSTATILNIWMNPENCLHTSNIWKTSVYLHNLFSFHPDAFSV